MKRTAEPLPTQIGPYKIVKRLGSGGMGDVYRCKRDGLDREVALKVLRPTLARDERLLKRFTNEARAASMPAHENLVRFIEKGQDNEYHFLAFEYVDGRDVGWLLKKKGPLPVAFTLHVVKQAVRALDHAHKHGFVHRDIKPANILITRDKVAKVADLGLARQLEGMEDEKVTRDGYTLGTVDYMSPEQCRDSHAADIRSDIYSLGCTWFHMLTGSVPYPGGDTVERLIKHARSPIPSVREAVPEIPEQVDFVVAKMMEKAPEDRYQTPTELLEELESLDLSRVATDVSDLAYLAEAEQIGDLPDAKRGKRRTKGKHAKEKEAEQSETPTVVQEDSDEIPEAGFVEFMEMAPAWEATKRRRGPGLGIWLVSFAVGCIVGLIALSFLAGGSNDQAVKGTEPGAQGKLEAPGGQEAERPQ